MKKKLFLIIIIVIAILLMFLGVYVSLNNKESSSNDDNKTINVDNSYKIVEKASDNELTTTIIESNFEDVTRNIGFDKTICKDGFKDDTVQIVNCSSKTVNKADNKLSDTLSINYTNGVISDLNISLYISEDMFNANAAVEKINSVLNNFFGTGVTIEQISSLNDSLQKVIKDESPLVSDNYVIGKYGENVNIQYLKDSKLYLIRLLVTEANQEGKYY